MNSKEFEAVLGLPGPKRYEYFIKKVADFEEVWGLYAEGWVTSVDDDGTMRIPFWPKEEFAKHCAEGLWAGYEPLTIDLSVFIEKWLPGMKKDGYKPAIFFNGECSVGVEIDKLLRDLQEELENY